MGDGMDALAPCGLGEMEGLSVHLRWKETNY